MLARPECGSRPLCLLLALSAALSCRTPAPAQVAAPAAPAAAADEAFRAQVPPPQPAAPLHVPQATRRPMANGMQLLVAPKAGLPLVSAQLVVRSGSAQDPPNLPGVAGFVAEMLRTGSEQLSAREVAERCEDRGTSIDVSVSEDAIVLEVTALSEHFPAVFDVLADICLHPRFAPEEIERLRRQRLGRLRQSEDQPSYAATHAFRRALFGGHAYGHLPLGEAAAVATISRGDLVAYFNEHFQPGNAALVLSGDIDEERAWTAAQRGFGLWQGSAKAAPAAAEPPAGVPEVRLIDRPGSSQATLVVGLLGSSRGDPDHAALTVLNSILGGAFNSRINMNLREDKGYTYGAFSRFTFPRRRGAFEVHTRVRSDATAAALREIFREIEGMRQKEVGAEELADAKNRSVLSIPSLFQTVSSMGHQVAGLYLYDLPLDELAHLPERIAQVGAEDIRRLAVKYLDPEQLIVVVLGDAATLRAPLEALMRGPVRATLANGELAAAGAPGP